jgi:hypothetical protein
MTTTTDTARAITALRRWADDVHPGEIAAAIVGWTADAFEHEPDASADDVIRHLEMTDCAACHAPGGLIYNHHIARKLEAWWPEIDDAIAAYHDATGENPRPRDGALTLGWLVWFAVEWTAQEAASWLRAEMEG